MKTGVVIELRDGMAVLFERGGGFVTVPARADWEIGAVVRFGARRHARTRLLAAAACLALALGLGGGGSALYFTETALVSIDVNPSIELSLNRFDRVLSAAARNPEAEAVLAQAEATGKPYADALAAILDAERMGGYLQSSADVVVTVYAHDTAREAEVLGAVRTATDTAVAQRCDADAEYHTVDAQTVSGAHGRGVTAGKYLYLEQLRQADPQLDIAQFSHHSIPQLRGEIAACEAGGHAEQAENEVENGAGNGAGNGHGAQHRHGQNCED